MEHCNLYYIFLEDKAKNPMPEERREKILKIIINIFKNIKPP